MHGRCCLQAGSIALSIKFVIVASSWLFILLHLNRNLALMKYYLITNNNNKLILQCCHISFPNRQIFTLSVSKYPHTETFSIFLRTRKHTKELLTLPQPTADACCIPTTYTIMKVATQVTTFFKTFR